MTDVTDAEAGEFQGRAICRDCGDDLPDDLARLDVGYCARCAGVPDPEPVEGCPDCRKDTVTLNEDGQPVCSACGWRE